MAAMDFLRVIKGAVDQDTKNTKEKLKETTERLKAERALMIDSKKRSYDSKNKIIDEEIKKFKSIQAVNDSFGDKKPAPSEWGRVYAINNKPTEYAAMAKTFANNPQALQEYLASFSNNANFKVQGSKELLDKKYQEDVKAITLEADKQIKNARGDSFLINKILGIKKNKIDSVTQGDTNEDSKAIETAKQVAAATDTDKPFVFGDETTVKRKRTPPKEYQTAFATAKDKAVFKSLSDKDNLSSFIGLSKKLGFGSEMNFKFDNKDSKIVGVGDSANAFLETYKKAYDNILNSYNDIDLYDINKNRNSISSVINEQEIKRQVENMMIQRENVLTTGEGFNLTSNKQLMAIIPLNIVDTSNRSIINGKPVSINIPESNQKYNEFLKMKAKSAYGTYEGDVGIRNLIKVQNAIENDKFGNSPLSQELKKVLVIEKPTEDTSKNNVPPKPTQAPKSKIQITSEGLLSDRGLLRWESPQIQNRIDSLTPAQKKAYDEWKAKGGKNNTKTKSLSNPSYMRPAKPDIITPKVKQFMQDTKKTEGEFGSGA
tara:strand:- start:4421 stop:6052 length:1632 start_codon:yes stop_codon:yes gene_type:complete